MKKLLYITLLLCLTSACSKFKENVGLVKYQPDEYQVVTNPSLDVPPNFNVHSPSDLEAKKNNAPIINHDDFSKTENSVLRNMKTQ